MLPMPTTPTKPAQAKVCDTPTHDCIDSFHPFTSTAEEYDPVFVIAANEMRGKYFGPVSTREFFKYYLPESTEGMPVLQPERFRSVATQKCETKMYDLLVSDH